MRNRFVLVILSLVVCFVTTEAAGKRSSSASGFVKNPMLWADVPDPDIIRVGDTFYLVTTTMHLMPGAPIMSSKDFLNWKTVGYVFDKLTDSPKYDFQEGTVYGCGHERGVFSEPPHDSLQLLSNISQFLYLFLSEMEPSAFLIGQKGQDRLKCSTVCWFGRFQSYHRYCLNFYHRRKL